MWHFSDPCHTQLSDGSKVGQLDVLDKHHLYTLHSKEEFGKERAKRASPRYRSKLLKAHVNSPFTTLIYFKMDVWVDGWCALHVVEFVNGSRVGIWFMNQIFRLKNIEQTMKDKVLKSVKIFSMWKMQIVTWII